MPCRGLFQSGHAHSKQTFRSKSDCTYKSARACLGTNTCTPSESNASKKHVKLRRDDLRKRRERYQNPAHQQQQQKAVTFGAAINSAVTADGPQRRSRLPDPKQWHQRPPQQPLPSSSWSSSSSPMTDIAIRPPHPFPPTHRRVNPMIHYQCCWPSWALLINGAHIMRRHVCACQKKN